MHDFLQTPYIPHKNVTSVLLDYRAGKDIVAALGSLNIEVLHTARCGELYAAIDGHPDIVMHHVCGNKIVVAPNVFDRLEPVLSKKGFAMTKGSTWLIRKYPGNIAYNVLRIGSTAFHNTRYTDRKILEEYERNGIKTVHINQGYSKCSVCIVNEKAIITSDVKIAGLAEKYGIESLLIKPGGIELEGLDYGFIGGASGLLSHDLMGFSGKLEKIEEHDKILSFLASKGISVKILSEKQIVDIGSIIPLTC